MIKIEFDEPTDHEWIEWRADCETATAAIVGAAVRGEKPRVTDLYKRQRTVYLGYRGLFFGKCAYCETLIAENQPGDIEHFRPKGRVTDSTGHQLMVQDENGEEYPHPGYYWLAYDWRNLLPACEDCNRPSSAKTPLERIGKWDYFPVKDFRAVKQGDEDKEIPILLNPVFEDPQRHLSVNDSGLFDFLTPEGEECIRVFGLNSREALVDRRKETYDEVRDKVHLLMQASHHNSPDYQRRFDDLMAIKRGERPHSAIARLAIHNTKSRYEAELMQL
jgi:hypothetical protein